MRAWKRWGIVAGWTTLILFAARLDMWLCFSSLDTKVDGFPLGGDFTMYYAAARALRLNPHANIYMLATLREAYAGGCGAPPQTTYPYQPLLALLLEPFTLLMCSTALYLWWQLSFLLWAVITYWFASDTVKRYGAGRGLLVGVLCITYIPVWNGLEHGQLHLLILFLFVLASRLAAAKRFPATGGVLAVGVVLKYIPAFLVAYHLVRGHWRVAFRAALVGGALLVGELLLVGPGLLATSIGGATSDVAAYSATAISWLIIVPDGVLLARLALAVTFVVVLVMAWRGRNGNNALGEGWVLCSLLLVTPLPWYHYLTWLLPSLVALLHATLDCLHRYSDRPGRSVFSIGTLARGVPFVGLAGAIWVIDAVGAPAVIGPALFLVWGLCAAFYVASAGIFEDLAIHVPMHVGPRSPHHIASR
jgi:hypothetical protein